MQNVFWSALLTCFETLFLTLFLISKKMYKSRAYKAAFNGIGGKKKVHNHKECSCLLKMNDINHIQLSFLFKLFINKTNHCSIL